jgi:hypothetical protein
MKHEHHKKAEHHLSEAAKHHEKAKMHMGKAKEMEKKHMDVKEDKKLMKKMVKKDCMK